MRVLDILLSISVVALVGCCAASLPAAMDKQQRIDDSVRKERKYIVFNTCLRGTTLDVTTSACEALRQEIIKEANAQEAK